MRKASSLISSTHDSAMYAIGLLWSSTVPGAESAKQDRGCANGNVDQPVGLWRPEEDQEMNQMNGEQSHECGEKQHAGPVGSACQREDHKPLLVRLVSHSDPVFDQRIQGGLHRLSHVRKAITARRRTEKATTSPPTLLQGTEPPIPLDKTTKSTLKV